MRLVCRVASGRCAAGPCWAGARSGWMAAEVLLEMTSRLSEPEVCRHGRSQAPGEDGRTGPQVQPGGPHPGEGAWRGMLMPGGRGKTKKIRTGSGWHRLSASAAFSRTLWGQAKVSQVSPSVVRTGALGCPPSAPVLTRAGLTAALALARRGRWLNCRAVRQRGHGQLGVLAWLAPTATATGLEVECCVGVEALAVWPMACAWGGAMQSSRLRSEAMLGEQGNDLPCPR